jgi:hypothetical protein
MQANSRVWKLLVAALIVVLLVVVLFGGGADRTRFNLPSIRMQVQPNGAAQVYGFNLPMALLQPAQIQQFQAANMQRLEPRWGHNGLHVYVNGQDMPYLAWNEASMGTLQRIVRTFPNIPNRDLIANVLPWLRRIGGGLRLDMPLAAGATPLDIPRWNGETSVQPAPRPEPPTLGPLAINSVAFDENGNAYVGPVPLSNLGVAFSLPPDTLALIRTLDIDSATVRTEPDGLHILLDQDPFPTLAYDAAYLERAVGLANTLAPNAENTETLNSVAGILPGADVEVAVSFTGEPVGITDLSGLAITINPDGSVRALGIDIPMGPLVPPEILSQLQAANIQTLNVNLRSDGLGLVADGQALPAIGWTPAGLNAVSTILGPLAGISQQQLTGVLDIVQYTNLGLTLNVPGADGSTPAEAPAAPTEGPTFAPVDLGEFAPPVIRANLDVDSSGNVTSVGNLEMATLAAMRLPANISLPPNVMQILNNLGADQIDLTTGAGNAELALDGNTALTLQYDEASLRALLELVKPFLGVAMLEDPAIAQLIDQVVMPLAPGAEIDLGVNLQ